MARRLYESGHDVVVLDKQAEAVDAIGPFVTRALVGDATKKGVLEAAGASDADAGIISTGGDLGASILALLGLHDLGISEIYVKVRSEEQARIVTALGASDTIFPEKEAARNLASKVTTGSLLQYVTYTDQFAIQEMAVPASWEGKSLIDLRLTQQRHIQVVAVHDMLTDRIGLPDPQKPLTPSDALLVAGRPEDLKRLAKLG